MKKAKSYLKELAGKFKDKKEVVKALILGGTTATTCLPLHEDIHGVTAIAGGGEFNGIKYHLEWLLGKNHCLGEADVTPTRTLEHNYMNSGHDVWINNIYTNVHSTATNLMPNLVLGTFGMYYLKQGLKEKNVQKIAISALPLASSLYNVNPFTSYENDGYNATLGFLNMYGHSPSYLPFAFKESGISPEMLAGARIGVALLTLGLCYVAATGAQKINDQRDTAEGVMNSLEDYLTENKIKHKTKKNKRLFNSRDLITKIKFKKDGSDYSVKNNRLWLTASKDGEKERVLPKKKFDQMVKTKCNAYDALFSYS